MRTPEPNPDTVVFFRDKFVPLRDAHVGMLTHALNYGTGVFEGIRGYWDAQAGELHLVRPIEHYHRWKRNASIIRIHIPQSVTELCDISAELVRRNHFETDLYFRPLAFKSAARIGVHADEHDSIAIAAVPFGVYIESTRGISAGVSSWRRIEDSAIPGRAKICGAYVNSTLATDEARRNG
ncbi:MAG TPA: branched chain amino acid aminotransferase, partial [Solibacterales bacterium]|nr:branched chain amino acid aminotransferase [Bryobacterales bacterium]